MRWLRAGWGVRTSGQIKFSGNWKRTTSGLKIDLKTDTPDLGKARVRLNRP